MRQRPQLNRREVERIERLVGPEVKDQQAVLSFIKHHYQAETLAFVPRVVFNEICRRPVDFVLAARRHAYPELF